MKKPVKRSKSKSARKAKPQIQDPRPSRSVREVEDQENHKSQGRTKIKRKSVAPKARAKLKNVAKKAATAAVVAAGLAALDTALGELKPKEGAAADKTEPKE